MRTCVIFNPAAKGQKAGRLRARLNIISQHAALKQTAGAGDARRLAAEAIAEGCTTVIAAGGDGTVNEVVNGIGDARAFDRVRLGVLPLGTVNVFARELKIPADPARAWKLILRGRYTRIDLGWAEFSKDAKPQRQYFMQLDGAGLDARAIELVDWRQKKKIGPLAYIVAGLKALREPQP
ncbi:MAG: diacylglycerol kinase family protein, partial [Verrucomicrobia bacterium]|nr:diacylglycerol kinase family protein [Verrucomicrobiota bacterium]